MLLYIIYYILHLIYSYIFNILYTYVLILYICYALLFMKQFELFINPAVQNTETTKKYIY